ncbi:hypothetical protein LCI18_001562 [Fusarium solani-melongenae]|uniref:Uncharacterized protein n=1 Tax=Fusarium solani subsp. cucurbitae TaxID=2747967 RepID=A0ACD3YNR7_FUSSC|nr:hypothetical protein LCI18_001562 [Fusarium solani-melongenae]
MANAHHRTLAADPGDESLASDLHLDPGALMDLDALTFPLGEGGFDGHDSSFQPAHPDFFNTSIDELWSASLAHSASEDNIADVFEQLLHNDPVSNDGPGQASSDPSKTGHLHNISVDSANSGCSPAVADAIASPRNGSLPPKIGHRFTRESARVLKRWFSEHSEHPYPSEEEKTMLQCQTGLNRTQVTNWLANARRRRAADGSARASSRGRSGSAQTSRRAGTPIPRSNTSHRNMDPLQRWVDSPPENEPAAASAIARAMASRDALPSLTRRHTGSSDEGSTHRRRHASSASSFATSSASTDSRSSKGSISASSSLSRGRSYRKRRTQKTSLAIPRHAFQCTFCTETFRTKYDWQRHENSLHLPLERWVCSPHGPTAVNPENDQRYCVFCGEVDPSETHLVTHNPAACQERSFSRKDHLKQHLRLVHNAGLIDLSLKLWKAEKPEIKSRCGFCKAELETWLDRVDHLSNHFKLGCTMADWSGNWGFDESILETLENAMPPYLIDFERGTPFPFEASGKPPDSPRSAYELLTIELAYFIQSHYDSTGDMPNNKRLQLEACRIIFASEVMFPEENPDMHGGFSWLRDLILSSPDITQQARFGPIRSRAESRLSVMKIKGKNALFETCPLESHLHTFVHAKRAAGVLVVQDHELQKEACRIITLMEDDMGSTPDFVANWLVTLISKSTDWLHDFRRRANLLLKDDLWSSVPQSGSSSLPSWMTNDRQVLDLLSNDLGPRNWANTGLLGLNNADTGMQHGGLPNGQTSSADLVEPWLGHSTVPQTSRRSAKSPLPAAPTTEWPVSTGSGESPGTPGTGPSEGDSSLRPAWLKTGIFILNDSNHHRWLKRELARWVTATMSPNNPNCHIPSDEELRHQARCLLFNDDDPWNQTAADSPQWLDDFKRDCGIL